MIRRICIFCGSSPGHREIYGLAAEALGRTLAHRNIGIVYGGSHVGLMGILADTALRAGGEVIGVIPQILVDKEVAHRGLTDLRIAGSMHERKAVMADLADAFIAMPGGFGTFEEFCEILTWTQLGIHRNPAGILNVDGFYDPLLDLFDQAVREGFLRQSQREMVIADPDPETLVDALGQLRIPLIDKWIGNDGASLKDV